MDCSDDCVFAVELLWTLFYKLLPPPSPPTCPWPPICPPPATLLAQNWCAPSKNDLKWPQIKQVTNSELHCNKANRLFSPILQKIIGLTRAKAVKIFKMGISTIITRCELGWFSRGWSHNYITEDASMVGIQGFS